MPSEHGSLRLVEPLPALPTVFVPLVMDWLFASGCPPPRLSTTQWPSATDSQCSVRRGLSPRCWCALSGARGLQSLGAVLGDRSFVCRGQGMIATSESLLVPWL